MLLLNSNSFIESKSFAYFIARAAKLKSGGRKAGIILRSKDENMGEIRTCEAQVLGCNFRNSFTA